MEIREIEAIIEGILFASGEPFPVDRLAAVLGIDRSDVESISEKMADYYNFNRRGIRLLKLENSLQLCSRSEYAEYIRRALETRKAPALSPAALEVLAIVAYRQPVTKPYIEQIRGVDSTYTVTSLMERNLIEEAGRLDVPGRPNLYKTTEHFLRTFGLTSLSDLPQLDAFSNENGSEQLSFLLGRREEE